jgi:DNA repair exonuclease SbcCD ATPase subunit
MAINYPPNFLATRLLLDLTLIIIRSKERITMTNKLTRAELIELFKIESKDRLAEIDRITKEVEARSKDVEEISEKIVRGEVRSAQEIHSLAQEIEHHLARVKELRAKADVIRMDNLMDLEAIKETY